MGRSILTNERVTLYNNAKLISNEHDVAHIFNSYFANILSTLSITHWQQLSSGTNAYHVIYPEYSNHPGNLKINEF